MEITFNTFIPDDVVADLQNGSTTPLPRRLLELAAIRAYEAGLLMEWGVIDILGLADREELYDFFKANDVLDTSFTLAELEKGQAKLAALLDKS